MKRNRGGERDLDHTSCGDRGVDHLSISTRGCVPAILMMDRTFELRLR
jgi:hypothetical protein